MVVVHGQVHAAAGDAGLVREDGQRGLVLAVVPPVRARRRDARLDARAPDPRLDDVRVVAVEARGADDDDKRSCRRRRSALRRYLIPLTEDEQLRREVVAWRAADDRCRNGCCPRTPSDASLAALSRPGPRRPGPGRAGTRRALRRIPARVDG